MICAIRGVCLAAYLLLGATFAFAAAVQPGPLQTYLISQVLTIGWRRTLPAALSPLISDGPIIVVSLVVLSRLPGWLGPVLQLAGGVFLFYLARGALGTFRTYGTRPAEEAPSGRRSLLKAALVNVLNPNPWLAWSLVLGPLLIQGWRERPENGIALLVSFYGTMVVSLAAIIGLFSGARNLGPRVGRGLVGASAVALAGFGVYQLWSAARAFQAR
jgi:threonine/homoserine/homoserine lactone efflux protein